MATRVQHNNLWVAYRKYQADEENHLPFDVFVRGIGRILAMFAASVAYLPINMADDAIPVLGEVDDLGQVTTCSLYVLFMIYVYMRRVRYYRTTWE